jgi:hypothetical protein
MGMRFVRALCALVLVCSAAAVQAHPSPSSEVLLTAGDNEIGAEVTLPVEQLVLAFPGKLVDSTGLRPVASDAALTAYVAAHVRPVAPDGRAWSVRVDSLLWELGRQPADLVAHLVLRPPAGAPLGRFTLEVDAIAHQVPNHLTLVALRDRAQGPDAKPRMLASLYYGHRSVQVENLEPGWWSGLAGLFKAGMRHIAEGPDHLLFLVTLLLPAGLRAEQGRWAGFAGGGALARRLLVIVSAFTLGHSLTLMLGASGLAVLPEQPVEVAIALSIMVCAAHAWGPIFPAREAWIAAGFGMVHGLAFAAAIRELKLEGTRLAAGMLAFNLGIEAVQALLVLLAMPLLIVLARSGLHARVRQAGAVGAMLMGALWMVQRVKGVV